MINNSTEYRPRPVAAGLFIGGIAVVCALVSIGMAFPAWDRYSAAHGTSGTPGTVTVTHKDGLKKSRPCLGTFRPDTDGPQRPQIEVHLKGRCTPGRVVKARALGDDEAFTRGGGGWATPTAISAGFGLAALVVAILCFYSVRSLRRRAARLPRT